MSPRAAWRLETLGFTRVYDYVGGKADWFAAGLPREGRLADVPRAGDVARHGDVTCRLADRLGDVAAKVRAVGKETCVVVTDGGILLGRVRGEALDGDPEAKVEEVMESDPTTVRTNTTLDSIVERLRSRNVDSILVTTADGKLVGTLCLSDAERRLVETGGDVEEDEASCNCKG